MSRGPSLARWLRSNLHVAAVTFVILSFASEAPADDDVRALPDRVTKVFTKVLPDTWTHEVQGSRLVLRPRENPVFVNLTNGPGERPDETWDDYKRRHIVEFDYRIVLRFEPKLSFREFWSLVNENERIHDSLQVLERSPHATAMKGSIAFSKTPQGEALSEKHEQLLKSFRSVPAGYLGDASVYIEPTYLGYADFFDEKERRDAEEVEKRIRDQLTPYDVNDQPASTTSKK